MGNQGDQSKMSRFPLEGTGRGERRPLLGSLERGLCDDGVWRARDQRFRAIWPSAAPKMVAEAHRAQGKTVDFSKHADVRAAPDHDE